MRPARRSRRPLPAPSQLSGGVLLPDETTADIDGIDGIDGRVNVFPLGRMKWLTSAALRQRFTQALTPGDAYRIHGVWQEHCAMTAAHASRQRKPYVVSTHGMLDAWALANKSLKKRVYAALAERRHLKQAACVRALTQTERDDCRRFGLRNPVAVIPNGVEIPDVSSDEFFARFPDLLGKRLVLFMGRIHYKKGPRCCAARGPGFIVRSRCAPRHRRARLRGYRAWCEAVDRR